MLEILGQPGSLSRRAGRRAMLQAGGAGLFGMSLGKVLAAEAAATAVKPRAKSVIFLFLFGGPSQYETFDMKPEAPADIRGPMSPIEKMTRTFTRDFLIGQHYSLGLMSC